MPSVGTNTPRFKMNNRGKWCSNGEPFALGTRRTPSLSGPTASADEVRGDPAYPNFGWLHMARDDLYDPIFIRGLFDEMAATYGPVNLLSSFGFCIRWRRQCLRLIDFRPGSTVLDLMCGMGELGSDVADRIGGHGSLLALDLSPVGAG